MRTLRFSVAVPGLLAIAFAAGAQTPGAECRVPPQVPVSFVEVPGRPFGAVPTPDGCWLLVSFSGATSSPANGVAVLRWAQGALTRSKLVPLGPSPTGMAMTHDGKVLAVATGSGVTLLDVGRVLDGSSDPFVGFVSLGGTAGVIYVAVTEDDTLLFTANEGAASVTVVDLPMARSGLPGAVIGTIPVGGFPVGLVISPDQRWLYSTSQYADDSWGWPLVCPYAGQPDQRPEGAVVIIDVERARTDPAGAAMQAVPARCTPVRGAVDPGGRTLWVTARGSNQALAFDTVTLFENPATALLGPVPVGPAPVGIAVFGDGRRVVVADSNRFDPNPQGTLTVIDATRPTAGGGAVIATLQAGAFPREVAVSPDGRTLFVTNYFSGQVEVVDLRPFLDQPLVIADLGTLGGDSSFPVAMNNHGQVIGLSRTSTGTQPNSFTWTTDAIIDLGMFNVAVVNDAGQIAGVSGGRCVLREPTGSMIDVGASCAPRGINASGQVVGYYQTATGSHAFSWTKAGGLLDLGTLGGTDSVADAVNGSGLVVGASNTVGNSLYSEHAFSWTSEGGLVDLGSLNGYATVAWFVNENGQVAGTSWDGALQHHAFLWTDGAMVDLGTLGGSRSEATGLNNKGQVVGWSETVGDAATHAFLWTDGAMLDLGALPGGTNCRANGINDNGQVVGSCIFGANSNPHAFLWRDGIMVDLGTLGGDTSVAFGVNAAGQVLGYSSTAGNTETHAVVWMAAAARYTVSVTKAGTGGGTVTSDDGTINCGSTCKASIDAGSTVTLTATPDANSTFGGWIGNCRGTSKICTLQVNAAKTATATFLPAQPLTLNYGGTAKGSVSGVTWDSCSATGCKANVLSGSTVVLTGVPDGSSLFAGWGVVCTGTGSCSIKMNGPKTVLATFQLSEYPLTVTIAGKAAGNVTSTPSAINCTAGTCNAQFANGASVQLKATWDPTKSMFKGWSGGVCKGKGDTCAVTMSSAKGVTATFEPASYQLSATLAGGGNGTISGTANGTSLSFSCSGTLCTSDVPNSPSGVTVALTATAGANSVFAGWSGCSSSSGNACSIYLTDARQVVATFQPASYTLTLHYQGTGKGTVSGVTWDSCTATGCTASVANGASVTLTAAPTPPSTFKGWGVTCTGTGTCTIKMNSAKTLWATFNSP